MVHPTFRLGKRKLLTIFPIGGYFEAAGVANYRLRLLLTFFLEYFLRQGSYFSQSVRKARFRRKRKVGLYSSQLLGNRFFPPSSHILSRERIRGRPHGYFYVHFKEKKDLQKERCERPICPEFDYTISRASCTIQNFTPKVFPTLQERGKRGKIYCEPGRVTNSLISFLDSLFLFFMLFLAYRFKVSSKTTN